MSCASSPTAFSIADDRETIPHSIPYRTISSLMSDMHEIRASVQILVACELGEVNGGDGEWRRNTARMHVMLLVAERDARGNVVEDAN